MAGKIPNFRKKSIRTRFQYSLLFTNHRDTEKCFALKLEMRNPKHETNTKPDSQMFKTQLSIETCLVFRSF